MSTKRIIILGVTRAGKYGSNLAIWIEHTISTIPESQRKTYRTRFMNELKKYSFEPRKEGTPQNSGCINELEEISIVDLKNPEDLAKLVKEGMHLMYQKRTSFRAMKSLMEYLDVE
jgi:hypothetical protein